MKISVITLYDENRKGFGDYSSEIMERYCKERGYTFTRLRSLLNPGLHPSWNKLLAVQQHLSQCDWIFWVDADAVIVQPNTSLEALIAPHQEKSIVFSSDLGGLCAGVFFIKNTPWSFDFLKTILFLGEEPECRHLYEQKTIQSICKLFPSIASCVGLIPEEVIQNPRSQFSPNAFMMHFWANQSSFEMVKPTLLKIAEQGWKEKFFWAPVKVKGTTFAKDFSE